MIWYFCYLLKVIFLIVAGNMWKMLAHNFVKQIYGNDIFCKRNPKKKDTLFRWLVFLIKNIILFHMSLYSFLLKRYHKHLCFHFLKIHSRGAQSRKRNSEYEAKNLSEEEWKIKNSLVTRRIWKFPSSQVRDN